MIDHPKISDPDFTTNVVSWQEGGLHFFEALRGSDGTVLLETYYLSYILTASIALFTVMRSKHEDTPPVGWYERISCVVHVTAGSLIGARVFYALVYNFQLFVDHPELWLGGTGMSTHGAILGALFGAWVWGKRFRYPFKRLLDEAAFPLAYGTFLGRIANFLNGELYGRSAPDGLPWAMRFPMRDGQGRSLLVNDAGELFARAQQTIGTDKLDVAVPVSIDQNYERASEMGKVWLPTDQGGNGTIEGGADFWQVITDPRHPSQLYQALSDGLLLLVFLLIVSRFVRSPGARAAWALFGYGFSRFFMEFFRQPDPQMGYLLGIFSTGQVLSMCVIGAALFWLHTIKRTRDAKQNVSD